MNIKHKSILLVVLIILLAGALGALDFMQERKQFFMREQVLERVRQDAAQQDAKKAAGPLGWKQYEATSNGVVYQVAYPSGWHTTILRNGAVGFAEPEYGFNDVWALKAENASLQEVVNRYVTEDKSEGLEVITKPLPATDGVGTLIVSSKPETDLRFAYVVREVGGNVFVFIQSSVMGVEESFEDFYRSLRINK